MHMSNPLVTIAIPAFKSAFLTDSIRSVLKQQYPHFELIVLDDNSPEDLFGIVRRFQDSRIRFVRNEVNLGHNSVAHTWNKCIELANGEYFLLLCDDDMLLPNMVSAMLSIAKQYPECGMFHANRYILHKSGEQVADISWPSEEDLDKFINHKFAGERPHTISEFFYRTDAIRNEKYAIFPAGYYSDDVTILQLCMRQRKMVSSIDPLVIFRESDIHISGSNQYIEGKILAFIQYYRYLQSDSLLTDRISLNGYECILSQYLMHCDKKTIVKLLPSLPVSCSMLKTILYLFFKR